MVCKDPDLLPIAHSHDFKEYAEEHYQVGETGAFKALKKACSCGEKEVSILIGHFGAKK